MTDDLARFAARDDETIDAALPRLLANGSGLLVVTDAGGAVVGTVTDSAVRRFALSDAALSEPVTAVMSKTPVVAGPAAGDEEVAGLLVTHRLRALPVVDGDRLLAVRQLTEFPDRCPPAPVAVVMVGGRGERLRPLTDKVPKPLLRIGATTLVERIIAQLAAAGVTEVFLAVNYMAEQFEERLGDGSGLGVTLHYVREDEPLGTAGALSLLPSLPDRPLLVTNGDLVHTIDMASLFDFHWHHAGAITVSGVEHLTHVPYGVLRTAEHHLLGIEEKPERRDFVSAGIYVVEPELLRFVRPATPMGMPDLIDEALAEGLPVNVFPILEGWFDIGSPEEFERVLLLFATGEEE